MLNVTIQNDGKIKFQSECSDTKEMRSNVNLLLAIVSSMEMEEKANKKADDIPAQTTDTDDKYFFGNLAEGKYIVKVTPPAGYEPTTSVNDPNNDDGTDSNGVNVSTGGISSNPIDLTWGAEPANDGDNDPATNLTIGFGFKPSLGAAPIPTLSEWGLILMSLLMAVTAFFRRRER